MGQNRPTSFENNHSFYGAETPHIYKYIPYPFIAFIKSLKEDPGQRAYKNFKKLMPDDRQKG